MTMNKMNTWVKVLIGLVVIALGTIVAGNQRKTL
jgi:hypothetical protein